MNWSVCGRYIVMWFMRHNNIIGHPEAWSDLKPLQQCPDHRPGWERTAAAETQRSCIERAERFMCAALSSSPSDSCCSFPILARTPTRLNQSHTHPTPTHPHRHTHTRTHPHTRENLTPLLHYHITVMNHNIKTTYEPLHNLSANNKADSHL